MSTAPHDEDATRSTYRRLFDLSRGGMGSVELTMREEGRFKRLYAMKRLLPGLRDKPDARRMFLEEGRLAGLIQHPNVVGVLDVGEDREGPFLVMEYVDGITVRDLVRAAKQTGLPLPTQLCCWIGAQAARGLAAAHSLTSHDGTKLDLVHRDISPQNILVGYDGVVRVVDFGIARAAGRDHRTSTGVLKGKLGYMAPEILRFEPARLRSDLFSFGTVLYEMLAGTRLYGGRDDATRARAILYDPPPDIFEVRDDVPVPLQALLVQLLAKDPALRPASASEVSVVLETVAEALAAEEGKSDIAEFVADGFTDARNARREALKDALAETDAAPETPSAASPPPAAPTSPSPRRALAAVAVAISLGLSALGVQALLAGRPSEEEIAAGPALPTSVAVSLSSQPEGARVMGDGMDPVTTPATLRLPSGEARVRLRFEREGYAPVDEWVVPDVDQRLRVQLQRVEIPPPAATEPEPEGRSAVSTPRRPRPRPRRAPPEPTPGGGERQPDFWLFGD